MDDFTTELPCGKSIYDFIWARHLDYFEGDALMQYREMVRTKRGPYYDEAEYLFFKDTSFIANQKGKTREWVKSQIEQLHADSLTWNGR